MMSHPHEGPMSEGREGGFDALVELGSVPTQTLHEINRSFDDLDQAVADKSTPRPRKLLITLNLLALSGMLAACGFWEGKSLFPPVYVSPIQRRVELSNAMYQSRVQATLESQQQERQAQEAEAQAQAEATAQMQYEQMLAEPEKYHPDWYQIATVEPNDLGVLAALERETGQTPYKIEGLTGGQIQMFIIVSKINGNRAYDWEHLLRDNPRIDPGDQILHTVMTPSELSAYAKHQDIPEENVFMVR